MNRLEQLLKMLEDAPDTPFVLFALAQEYLKNGDKPGALHYYETLVKTSPEYTGAYYHLGKLYEMLGRRDEAVSTYKTGMEITRNKNEQHAFGELQSALSMISDED